MNQQQLSEQTRNTKQRSFQHFKFEEFSHHEPRYRGKNNNDQGHTSGRQNKKHRQRKDGFRRYSDYLTYDSDEIENFDTDEESSLLKVDPDDSSEFTQAEKAQKSLHNATATIEKNSKQAQNAIKQRKDRKSQLPKQIQQQPNSSFSKPQNFIKQTANSLHSPFSVPNISQIKKKEYSSKRNSQQFLLNLLQQEFKEDPEQLAEKRKLIEKQQSQERQKRKREEEYKILRKKQAEQRQRAKRQEEKENRKKAQKMKELQREKKRKQAQQRQKKKQQRQKERQQRQIQKKKKEQDKRNKANLDKSKDKKGEKSIRNSKELRQLRQKQNNSVKDSKELQQKRRIQQSQTNKSKRVTINDRGRIKYPNDSISGQFQYILPQSLRRNQSSLKKPAIIQESDDEDLFKQEQVPMDIIDFEKQTELIQKIKKQELKIQLEKAQDRLQEICKKQTKKNTSNMSRGKKPIRVNNNEEKKQNQSSFANRQSSRSQKSKHKDNQKSNYKYQQARKRLKNSQDFLRKEQHDNRELTQGRPKRVRTTTLQYWKNQRAVYHNGVFLGCGNLSSSKFLEILRVEDYQKVLTTIVNFRSKQIKLQISLNPKDKIISQGVDEQTMNQFRINPIVFNVVEIQIVENRLGDDDNKELLKIMVNNQQKIFTSEPLRFRLGEKFSIENISMKIRYKFTIALVNSKKVGFTQDV